MNNEWEKEFDEKKKQWIQYGGFCYQDGEYSIDHIKKYISTILTTTAQRVREETLEEVFQIEKEKWRDAEHCTCLGYALVQLAGGEDSEGGKKMEERLSTLNK